MNEQILRFLVQAKDDASRTLAGVSRALHGVDRAASSASVGASRADSSFGKLSARLKTMASGAVTGAAVAGFAALTAAATAGVWAGLKYNSTIENTTMALSTMLKSMPKAVALVDKVKKMAAATPFAFPELADATKKFIAYGFAAGGIIKNLRMLGDVAAGTGVPLTDLVSIYGKMKLAGRLYAEDINQLMDRGIPIGAELAKVMGVQESKIRGLVEAGKIGFPQLQQAFKNMTKDGGLFAGMMAQQAKTFSGRLGTLLDDLNALLGASTKPLFKWLKDEGIPTVDAFIKKLTAKVEKKGIVAALEDMIPGFKDVLKTSKDLYAHFQKDWPQAAAWWQANGPGIVLVLEDIGKAIATVGDTALKVEEFLDRHKSAYDKLKMAATYLRGPLANVTDTILTVRVAISKAGPYLDKLEEKYNSLKASGRKMAEALKNAWSGVGAAAKNMWSSVSSHFASGYNAVVGWIGKVIGAVNKLLGALHMSKVDAGLPSTSRRGGGGSFGGGGDDGRSRQQVSADQPALRAVMAMMGGKGGKQRAVMPGALPNTGDPSMNPLSWLKGSMWDTVKQWIPSSGGIGFPMSVVPGYVLGKVKAWASKLMLPGGVGGGSAAVGGPGYAWAYALAKRFGLGVSSTFRPGAITAAGYPSDHGVYGRAADIAGSARQMSSLWRYVLATASSWKQAIYGHQMVNYGRLGYYAPSDHFDHVHLARATGDDSRSRAAVGGLAGAGAGGGSITVNVVVPGGTTLIGTARQVGEIIAPHVKRALETDAARGTRRR